MPVDSVSAFTSNIIRLAKAKTEGNNRHTIVQSGENFVGMLSIESYK